jgi:hypothetical protein
MKDSGTDKDNSVLSIWIDVICKMVNVRFNVNWKAAHTTDHTVNRRTVLKRLEAGHTDITDKSILFSLLMASHFGNPDTNGKRNPITWD